MLVVFVTGVGQRESFQTPRILSDAGKLEEKSVTVAVTSHGEDGLVLVYPPLVSLTKSYPSRSLCLLREADGTVVTTLVAGLMFVDS